MEKVGKLCGAVVRQYDRQKADVLGLTAFCKDSNVIGSKAK